MIAAPTSAKLVSIVRHQDRSSRSVSCSWSLALLIFSRDERHRAATPLVAVVLVIIGVGMGLAMAPATDSIMGSLPPEKAGVGSAMNDTTREIGGALGVAILGSITAAGLRVRHHVEPGFAQVQAASPEAADAVKNSVGAASVAAESFRRTGATGDRDREQRGVHPRPRPHRARRRRRRVGRRHRRPCRSCLLGLQHTTQTDPLDRRCRAAARRRSRSSAHDSPRPRSGCSPTPACRASPTTRSRRDRGSPTATLERYWTSRVDAVTDALREIYEAHPVPNTGDLPRDLRAYVGDLRDVLQVPAARAGARRSRRGGGVGSRARRRRCASGSSTPAAASLRRGSRWTPISCASRSTWRSISSSGRCTTMHSSWEGRSTTCWSTPWWPGCCAEPAQPERRAGSDLLAVRAEERVVVDVLARRLRAVRVAGEALERAAVVVDEVRERAGDVLRRHHVARVLRERRVVAGPIDGELGGGRARDEQLGAHAGAVEVEPERLGEVVERGLGRRVGARRARPRCVCPSTTR